MYKIHERVSSVCCSLILPEIPTTVFLKKLPMILEERSVYCVPFTFTKSMLGQELCVLLCETPYFFTV
jgi:hypothetical protein